MNARAWTQWNAHARYYVAQLPGDGGKDWGYTQHLEGEYDRAIYLSPYWQRRFAADCARVGREARFIPTE